MAFADCIDIYKFQPQHSIDMATVKRIVKGTTAQTVYLGIIEIFCFCDVEHLCAVSGSQEFSFVVEQLQGIPLAWVMRSCDNDAAISLGHAYGQFCGWCGGISDVKNVIAHAHERSNDHVAHHQARDAAVAANHDLSGCSRPFGDEGGISRGELNNV